MLSEPKRLLALKLGMAVALCCVGCDQGETGAGLPTLSSDEVDSPQVPFEGVVRIGPSGCVMVEVSSPAGDTADRWAVWPVGAELFVGTGERGNGAVVDGDRLDRDVQIAGTAQLVGLEALPGEARPSGGYYAQTGRYCGADQVEVIVMSSVGPA